MSFLDVNTVSTYEHYFRVASSAYNYVLVYDVEVSNLLIYTFVHNYVLVYNVEVSNLLIYTSCDNRSLNPSHSLSIFSGLFAFFGANAGF
jgi:hypothetical protein